MISKIETVLSQVGVVVRIGLSFSSGLSSS
jgi:hypothetical protein